MRKVAVTLNVDLTRYIPGLVAGTKGFIDGDSPYDSDLGDGFQVAYFPIGTLPVLWSSITVTDEEFLKERELKKAAYMKELLSAKNIEYVIGERGGFRWLTYKYVDGNGIRVHASIENRKRAQKILDYFTANGLDVKTIKQSRQT